ncbi:zinc finger CCCH domain-containing protein 48-like [Arachis stenosperma]|uniref:zinc finger CCCH domain-containing protein 48-like n=1 Tax=Arachis stenosperma TaxID=217475 RepID=UPI0025AD8DD2|nr:zinc finger CCCH domain-containing protein 48-like [Arachis stenosperma]
MASSSAKKAFKKPENCALRAVEYRPEAMSVEKPTKCEQKDVEDVEDVATVAKASVDKLHSKMASSSAKKAIKKPENCALRAVEYRPEAMSVEKPTKCEQKDVEDVEDVATVAKASVDKLHSKMASSSAKKAIKKPENCALRAVEYRPEAMSVEKPTKCEQKAVADVEDVATVAKACVDKSLSICKDWMTDNCVHGDLCQNLHSWFYGDGFSTLAKLHEHNKAITGIALPAGSNKLISGSTDGTVRAWDCNTGRCVHMIHLNSQVTSLISEGPWIFAGVKNAVKAWNIQTGADVTLDGPKGQVLSLNVGNDILLAGAEDGVIYAWRCSFESPFKMVATLSGHSKPVVCLAIGCHKMLYSGSMDHTIKVWDLDTLQCTMTLNGHTDVVTSLICWDNFLLSASSDCTVNVWVCTEEGTLEVTYTHTHEIAVLGLYGMTDAEAKPILFCSLKDNSVRIYELPTFLERGRLFTRQEVQSFEIGPGGLFFTGDGTGLLNVWKWLEEPKVPTSSATTKKILEEERTTSSLALHHVENVCQLSEK